MGHPRAPYTTLPRWLRLSCRTRRVSPTRPRGLHHAMRRPCGTPTSTITCHTFLDSELGLPARALHLHLWTTLHPRGVQAHQCSACRPSLPTHSLRGHLPTEDRPSVGRLEGLLALLLGTVKHSRNVRVQCRVSKRYVTIAIILYNTPKPRRVLLCLCTAVAPLEHLLHLPRPRFTL